MDYQFFVKRIAAIPLPLVTELLTWAVNQQPTVHQGFRYQDVKCLKNIPETWLTAVADCLPVFTPQAITGSEIVILEPGESVGEHSDLSGKRPNHMWNAMHHHKVHVPLQSNPACLSLHRRTKLVGHTASVMDVGYAYLYNDYVWHSGHNHGTDTRYHLSVSFIDPKLEWLVRCNQLTEF